ncbi:multimeric flavodoxin [Lunatimonas lonarensis]|uniref:Multimeric flavodoxin n=1 Tax=Lunatimonas lonarensis TaxID=1232681 RepID=R7ZR64_9BACT|nr:flavodoxin family protein [Lunatimonas lonarensis]EON76509.1 multimeric flavodoxin [Lunatimonas lonarensis]
MYRFIIIKLSLLILHFASIAQDLPSVLITYYSQSGNTKTMAEAIARGVSASTCVAFQVKPIQEVTESELLLAEAIILGSPVYNGNMPPQVQEFINTWPFENRPFKDKLGAVFVTGGGFSIGEEHVMFSLIRSMLIHGMVIMGGEEVESSFGASAITGEGDFGGKEMDEHFLLKGEGLGKRVATWICSNRNPKHQ